MERCARKPQGAKISACCSEREAGSERLKFHLLQSPSVPLNLTGDTVTFYITKPDVQQIFLNADVPAATAEQGVTAVTLTAQGTAAAGIARHGEIRITANDNSVLKFPVPDLYIQGSDTENAVESTSEFHALDIALNSANKALKNVQSTYDSAQSMLDSDRQAVSDATGAAVNANTKADSANKAAADALNFASTANTAAKAVNDGAAAANTAVQSASLAASSANGAAQSCNNAISEMAAAAKTEVDKHALRTDNPHNVTAHRSGRQAQTSP